MDKSFTLHTVDTLPFIDSTVDEDTSYHIHSSYEQVFPFSIKYDSADYSIERVISLINTFAVFHGRIKIDHDLEHTVSSKIPLEVFRYKKLDDGSIYYVNTIPSKHKNGHVVEGAFWSNGMFVISRRNNITSLATLYIDQKTKDLYNYP
jgi:hypothetical protein